MTCQNVTKGIYTVPSRTSLPGGSLTHSGMWKIRFGLHQTIGSDALHHVEHPRSVHAWLSGGMSAVASSANRTVRPPQ